MDRGEQIFNWIKAQTDEGATVYAATYLKVLKITRKNMERGLVRYRGGHCEVARGRNWDSINFCKITAED